VIDRLQRVLTRHAPRIPGTREPDTDWRATLKRRMRVAAAVFALWAVGIETKLVYLQVYRHADLEARASKQQGHKIPAPAERGDIVDRKGRVLATSVDANTVYAVPSDLDNADDAAARLCAALDECTARDRQTLSDRLRQQKSFVYVRRQISPAEKQRVEALGLSGVGFIKESRRFYPNRELAAHLLGYVGLDNGGLGGLESAYDSQIRGKPGTVLIQTDARQHAFSTRVTRLPTAGSTVELTIDQYLQHIAERELHAGVVLNHAAGGTAIVMNPRTGEILAMANEPTFNPNAYRDSQETDRRNRAVQDLYEPGSTFKVVTASAAIEENVLPLETKIDTSPGVIRIDRGRVVDEFHHHNYGVLSFTDVIVKSSNVGAIKIGFKVGTDRLSNFVDRFGFGHRISPDFPGESPGIVWSRDKWTDSALASVSMGYQVGVTALQMVTAVSAVANGGELVEPRVVHAMYRDSRRYVVKPKILRRAVSPDTAAALTTIMEGVVERGTAKLAQIDGYTIAGKTGTATKLMNGRYSTSENNVSFVGFVPSREPAVAIIVMIDSPHANGNSGGTVSAPIFKRIAESTLRYLGVGPTINPAPPVLVARNTDRANVAGDARVPEPVVSLVADGPTGTVPDLRGLSARQAVRTLVRLGLIVHVSGDGFVVSQEPSAGAPLESGAVCRLLLRRTLPPPTSSSRP
jgi:cell division protein FtsI (penicillin-binding protein 3)